MRRTTLCEVKGDRPMRLICQALFNHYRIKAGGTPIRYDDTVATYSVSTDDKLTKGRAAEVTVFVKGMLVGLNAAGLHY